MVNEVRLIGNLGKDAEIEQKGALTICRFSVATEYYNPHKKEKETYWIPVVMVNPGGVSEYLTKGQKVYCAGYLKPRQWTDKQGNKKRDMQVVIHSVKLLGQGGKRQQEAKREEITDDDIPF